MNKSHLKSSRAGTQKKSKLQVFGWCLFDVANSSYTTAIITVFYGRIFQEVIVGAGTDPSNPYSYGNFLWACIIALSSALAAFSGPFLGAMSDLGAKKYFLGFSVSLCAISCLLMYFIEPGYIGWAALLILLSNIGFSLSENFVSAFLPHIAEERDMAKISGWSWGLGYFGGILSIVLIDRLAHISSYSAENIAAIRLVGPITGIFFLLFSIPTFLFVSEPQSNHTGKFDIRAAFASAVGEFRATLNTIKAFPDLVRFLLSYFFVYAGLSIVISFSSTYAAQVVGMKDSSSQVMFFLLINISAAVGAIFFGYLQGVIGSLRTFNLTLVIWTLTIFGMYSLIPLSKTFFAGDVRACFMVVGLLAGTCLGATQSSARTLVGLFSPASKSGEFFGFWGLSVKLAAVMGLVGFGTLQRLLPLNVAMLLCSVFFAIGIIFNLSVSESRGRTQSASK